MLNFGAGCASALSSAFCLFLGGIVPSVLSWGVVLWLPERLEEPRERRSFGLREVCAASGVSTKRERLCAALLRPDPA